MVYFPFKRLAIIGAGLIGTSIAHAAKNAAREVIVQFSDQDPGVRSELRSIFPDSIIAEKAGEAVRGADLVVLCVPVGAVGDVAEDIAPYVEPGAIVTDVGSVKASVVADVVSKLGEKACFIAGHPVAGSERSGPKAGFAGLFRGRFVILTPTSDEQSEELQKLTEFWQMLGAMVETMDPQHHDLVLALTSHLPHLIAYTIVGTAADFEDVTKSDVMRFSAGGFRDFTRIAASDPVMWRDIFLNNKDAVLEALGRFSEDLSALQRAIRWGDADKLEAWFTRTRGIRQGIIDLGQDTGEADFGRQSSGLNAPIDSLAKPYGGE
ncbi:MAG: prephenate/arogenate dehydrogenase family protein [Pseudomonadota bacterium]